MPVASVHQIEQDGSIMLSKLMAPTEGGSEAVDNPWYPADVRESAHSGIAELFTTTQRQLAVPVRRAPRATAWNSRLRPASG